MKDLNQYSQGKLDHKFFKNMIKEKVSTDEGKQKAKGMTGLPNLFKANISDVMKKKEDN